MKNYKKIYLDYVKFIMNFSRDVNEIKNIYSSTKVSLNDLKNIRLGDSKLISFGIFMIMGVPEPIVSDAIGLIFLGIGSILTKKKKDVSAFILNEFTNVTNRLDSLYDLFYY